MRLFLLIALIAGVSYGLYEPEEFEGNVALHKDMADPSSAYSHVDMSEFQSHLESLGSQLQTMPEGAHSFQVSSGNTYQYRVRKSNYGYCPHRKKKIYRDISVEMIR